MGARSLNSTIKSTLILSLYFSASAFADQPSDALEEVTVTATKTGATQLQKTPLAVSAFTADKLGDILTANIADLAEHTPNLHFSEVAGSAVIGIRGISSNNVFNGSDPDVTMQVDGVYIARPSGQTGDFLDVNEVEVLRGPQGTLYGRNAVGGTININSRVPTDQFTGEEAITVGNYGLFQNQTYLSGPLVDGKLQASIATNYVRHDDYEKNIFPGGPSGVNNANHGGGRLQLRWEPTDAINVTTRADLSAVDEDLANFDHLLARYPASPLVNSILGDYSKVALNGRQTQYLRNGGVSEDIDIVLNDVFSLKSLTAFRLNDYSLNTDNDATPVNVLQGHQHESENQISQEVDLTAKYGALDAVGGLFYFHEHDNSIVYAYNYGGNNFHATLPLVLSDSEAAFVQGTYHLTPTIGLTAGIRYTQESKSMRVTYLGEALPSDASLPGFPGSLDVTRKFAAGTPKFGVDWQVDPNALVYFSATRGYKSGGENYAATSLLAASFAPETIWSYEAGAKTELFDRRARLNVAAFHYDYSNLQIQALIGPGVTTITNAATASANGVEVEFTGKVTHDFELDANFSYLDAKYASFPKASVAGALRPFLVGDPNYNAAATTYDASGNVLNNAPTVSGSIGGKYTVPLRWGDTISTRFDLYYQSRTYFDATNNLLESQGAYATVNASATYIFSEGGWQAQLWGKNLTDKLYIVSAAANGVEPAASVAPPRTFGLRLSYNW